MICLHYAAILWQIFAYKLVFFVVIYVTVWYLSHLQPLLSHLISNSIVYNSTDFLLHVQVHIYLPLMLNVVSVYCIGIGKMFQKFIRIILYYG